MLNLIYFQEMTPIGLAIKNCCMRTALYLDSVLRAQGKKHRLSAYMKRVRVEKSGKASEKSKGKDKEKELTEESVAKVLKDLVSFIIECIDKSGLPVVRLFQAF